MKIIDQSWSWEQRPVCALANIEAAGRTCYKSDPYPKGKDEGRHFAKRLIDWGHESVIEHVSASVRIITNRGVSHELVRHRLCAFSQESTRYVKYDDVEFIRPVWLHDPGIQCESPESFEWKSHMQMCELSYKTLIENGWRPEQAREVLPNSLKTELVMTANLREWRHIFKMRASRRAHPQMRGLMRDMLCGFQKVVPVIFDNLED